MYDLIQVWCSNQLLLVLVTGLLYQTHDVQVSNLLVQEQYYRLAHESQLIENYSHDPNSPREGASSL